MVTENLKKFSTPVFPFTAIVGQEEMKLALQLNVIDPRENQQQSVQLLIYFQKLKL